MTRIDLNTYPYFDDFRDDKSFHRILFKPGFPVQARELTQLQTILQDQVRRFGSHMFKDGSVIFGCAESYNFRFPYVKIADTFVGGGNVIGSVTFPTLAAYKGRTLTGTITGVKAIIKDVVDGAASDLVNLKTFYVQYLASGGVNHDVSVFAPDEPLTISGSAAQVIVAPASKSPTGFGSFFSVDDGVVFANGTFVIHSKQTILLDKYTSTPSKRVGFVLQESIITHQSDPSLLDPAQGFNNYAAPGADRLQLTPVLTAQDLTAQDTEGFFLLFEVANGELRRAYNTTEYAELQRELARRTFDESGNYTVTPFSVLVREHLKTSTNNGKYTVAQGGDADKLAVGVEAGKAYVRGYAYETRLTEYVDADKGTDTAVIQNQYISTAYGNYFLVDGLVGAWALNAGTQVQLRSAAHTAISGTTYSTTGAPGALLGTARVRAVVWEPGSATPGSATARFRVYVFDMNATGDTTGIASLYVGTSGSASLANVVAGTGLMNAAASATVFPLTRPATKTLAPGGAFDTTFVTRRALAGTASSGTLNLSLSAGESWSFSGLVGQPLSADIVASHFIVVLASGKIIAPTSVVYNSASSVTLTLADGGAYTGNATVLADVRRASSPKNKSLIKDRCVLLDTSTHTNTTVGPYSLGVSDVFAIQQVWMSSNATTFADPSLSQVWVDVTSQFTLDNGQRDGHYGTASLVKAPGLDLTDKKIVVKFSYFTHTGAGSYFSVDSYPVDDTGAGVATIRTHEIPTFVTAAGQALPLRDSVDFRPRMADVVTPITQASISEVSGVKNPGVSSTLVSANIADPHPSETLVTDGEHYLGRIDKIAMDVNGRFVVLRGTSRQDPTPPEDIQNAMTIAYLNVPPFPSLSPYVAQQLHVPDQGVSVRLVDNRRHTMADIGQMARRIEQVEYQTKLSQLEQETANLVIPSATTGQNRFKNGILVDGFIGHNVGDTANAGYVCAIDAEAQELRPSFHVDALDMSVKSTAGFVRAAADAVVTVTSTRAYTGVEGQLLSTLTGTGSIRQAVPLSDTVTRFYLESVSGSFSAAQVLTDTAITGTITVAAAPSDGDLLTLPYVHGVYARNPFASTTRLAASPLLFTYTGNVTLDPPQDQWLDTAARPDVLVNYENTADNWVRVTNAWGSQWGSWRTSWVGVAPSDVATTPGAVLRPLGSRAVDATIVPYVRSRVVSFSANHLKPFTRVYPFFDGENVSASCRPLGGALGAALVTDAQGLVSGEFVIPANTFRTGAKTFILSDNVDNPQVSASETFASQVYSTSGLGTIEQDSIISTRLPSVTAAQATESKNLVIDRQLTSTGAQALDPIAQTFLVTGQQDGIFVTKLDLYFRTKSASAPVMVQIREVVNGLPSESIVPFSTVVVDAAQVNVSETAAYATPFVFSSPVYLKNDTEYCYVVVPAGNSADYSLWVSELGAASIGTSQRVSEVPNTGMLFVAANSRDWSKVPSEDLKYTLYQAQFVTETQGSVVFRNTAIDYLKVAAPVAVGSAVTQGTAAGKVLFYNPLTSVAKVSVTAAGFVPGVFSVDGVASGTIISVLDRKINTITPQVAVLDFGTTEFALGYRAVSNVSGLASVYSPVAPYETLNLQDESQVFSATNEVTAFGSGSAGTFFLQATASTHAANVSPVLDVKKLAVIAVTNSIGASSTGETGDAGSASSRYITKVLTLDSANEAEDLRVLLAQTTPGGSSVEVYCRVQHALDTRPFTSVPWVKMTAEQALSQLGREFTEYAYTVPVGTLSAGTTVSRIPSGTYAGMMQYAVGAQVFRGFNRMALKIVMLSPSTADVPRVRKLRGIALQV